MRIEVYVAPHGFVRFQTPMGEIVLLSPGLACQLASDLMDTVDVSTRRAVVPDTDQDGILDDNGLRARLESPR